MHTQIAAKEQEILSQASFDAHLSHFSHLPWLQRLKKEAWEQFQSIPMPRRLDEVWRFSNLHNISLEGYHLSAAPSEREQIDIVKDCNLVAEHAGRLVFEDNFLLSHDFVSPELEEKGVIWEPIIEAFEKHPELVNKYYKANITNLGSEKFHYLNLAFAHSGAFLYVPKGVEIKKPLVSYHWTNKEGSAIFPQTLVIAEAQSKVTVVDIYESQEKESVALSIAIGNIYAGEGAKVSRKTIQDFNQETLSFQLDTATVLRDGEIQAIAVNLGSKKARFENQAKIEGSGSQIKLYSLTVADKSQEFDQRTHQVHNAPHSISNLLYKNALKDEAKTTFSGLILVDEIAQQTDAYQTNRNLLLSSEAEANSLPGLKIEANDVKCSHGATTGQLDDRDLFYLKSRGLSQEKAEELMTFGFFEEIIEQIDNEEITSYLRQVIENKFKS